ncbi:hypothetical protein GCM10027169_24300 [Gordonia jinhuaensis]|uniref:Uncharacterized protein n=1 Tax=Gordonia jinhuaensis TaxID=1517702 RepID=A0A916TDT9_9ACTN|nr:hypothetical protein GCM10011489_29180 [Gordonia jinhuaensis]
MLCKILNFTYNPTSVARLERATSGDCGTGSYNSNGFVSVSDGTNSQEYVTFPTNAINYNSTAVVATKGKFAVGDMSSGKNGDGQRFGSAANAESITDVPELILSYGTEGQVGYIRAADIERRTGAAVTLYKSDGHTPIGVFAVSSDQ